MKQRISFNQLQDDEYYWGYAAGCDIPGIARWNGEEFVTWAWDADKKQLLTLTRYEFTPYELVTWGVNEIPL